MAGETVITVVGNLTADPELRYTNSGIPVANFTVASTPRTFDRQSNEWKDGDALFLRCSVWRDFAEHVAGSLAKGMRVIVQGNLRQRDYQDRDGNRRTTYELDVQDIGPSLRYATAQVTRAAAGAQQGFAPAQSYQPAQAGPASTTPAPATTTPAPATTTAPAPSAAPAVFGDDGWAIPSNDDTPF